MATMEYRVLGVLRIIVLGVVYGLSCYLLILRTMWMYGSEFMWWAYQILHVVLFLYFFRVCVSSYWKKALLYSVAVSIVIGWMPYDLWVSIILNPDPGLFSNVTAGLPMALRFLLEILFFPVLQMVIMIMGVVMIYLSKKYETRKMSN